MCFAKSLKSEQDYAIMISIKAKLQPEIVNLLAAEFVCSLQFARGNSPA